MNQRTEQNQVLPVLYIQQPYLNPPKVKMQKRYIFQETPVPIHIYAETKDIENLHKSEHIEGIDENSITDDMHEIKLVELSMDLEKKTQGSIVENDDNSTRNQQKVEIENINTNNEENIQVNVLETPQPELVQLQAIDLNKKLKREKQPSDKRIPFNDLSLEEKLIYLEAVPMTTAKIKFEFITEEGRYQGYFIGNKEENLQIILISRNEEVKLPNHTLTDIKMMGI